MSETISQMPTGAVGFLSDLIPLTQGATVPGTGNSRRMTTAKVLGSNGLVYAADPAYGVKADGASDDTSAWAAALNYASATGALVVAPMGRTIVSNVTIPQNTGIIGRNVQSYNIAGGIGSASLGSVFVGNTNSQPTITMAANTQLIGVTVDGDPAQDCIRINTGGAYGSITIVDVDIFGGLNGINGNTVPVDTLITQCRIHECANGIINCMDARVALNMIASCTTSGISLGMNCGDVLITENRIYACGQGIVLAGNTTASVTDVVITGNKIRDSSGNNISMSFCRNVTVTGNGLRGAGRSQTSTPGSSADASFQLANCIGCVVTGNQTSVGNELTNYVGPFWAIWDGGGNVNCVISSNILAYHNNASGAVSGPINVTSTFNLASALNAAYWSA